ncbi:hypothetical protein [Mucilaginibacter paludis]|nr:hypothetical protein [Mucilaginibacter paludis]
MKTIGLPSTPATASSLVFIMLSNQYMIEVRGVNEFVGLLSIT